MKKLLSSINCITNNEEYDKMEKIKVLVNKDERIMRAIKQHYCDVADFAYFIEKNWTNIKEIMNG